MGEPVPHDRREPRRPQRRPAVARAELVLDAVERLLLRADPPDIGLPAIAREAGIPLSSIYHLFPSTAAAFSGYVQRYAVLMDQEIEALLAGPLPETWQGIAERLLATVRGFYERHAALARLVLSSTAPIAARVADDRHIEQLSHRLAHELYARFELAPQRELPRRLAIAMAISDRVWAVGVDASGRIPDDLFGESVRAVQGYLSHYLPQLLEPRAGGKT